MWRMGLLAMLLLSATVREVVGEEGDDRHGEMISPNSMPAQNDMVLLMPALVLVLSHLHSPCILHSSDLLTHCPASTGVHHATGHGTVCDAYVG